MSLVAYNFVAVDRDQLMLMPPSVSDWLAEDHLAWFVLDVVETSWICRRSSPRIESTGEAGLPTTRR